MENGKETILFVDDDVRIVSALQRSLHRKYEIEIAGNAGDALDAIEGSSYAVVVSDLKMPGLGGVEFLTKVRQISPETVRILLTGYADVETAISAVNEGNIFRLLTKPCPQDLLTRALDAALTQYRLVTAESEALRETLNGVVELLVEVLQTVQPIAASHPARVLSYVRSLSRHLQLVDTWELEAAALLAQFGCITIPPEVLERYYGDKELGEEEERLLRSHPHIARRLLHNVPRLDRVAKIVERQLEPCTADLLFEAAACSTALGGQILKAALELDRLFGKTLNTEAALREMRDGHPDCHPSVQAALDRFQEELKDSTAADETPSESPRLESDSAIFRPITNRVLRTMHR